MKRVILLILALCLLGVGYMYVRRADAIGQWDIQNLSAEVEPLQQEKERLEKQRTALNEEYTTLLRDPSTIQFLFRQLNEEIFTDVYPLMRDHGIVGVLGVSTQQYPGRRGCLSKSQFSRLQMDGWGTCLVFDLDYRYNFDYWFNYMSQQFTRDGYTMPKAIFFPDNSYDPEIMDETLIAAGIETVVVNAEDGHSATISKVDALWFTGAMPWNYTGISNDIQLLTLTDGANLVFTVSIKDMWDAYEPESFAALLDSWSEYLVRESILDSSVVSNGSALINGAADTQTPQQLLKVCTFEDAREAHRLAAESRDSLVREHERQQAELDAQIEELEGKINAVYNDWNHQ